MKELYPTQQPVGSRVPFQRFGSTAPVSNPYNRSGPTPGPYSTEYDGYDGYETGYGRGGGNNSAYYQSNDGYGYYQPVPQPMTRYTGQEQYYPTPQPVVPNARPAPMYRNASDVPPPFNPHYAGNQ